VRVDEHERRVWSRMIASIDAYRAGDLTLAKLVPDLQGLLGAADLHDTRIINEFWDHTAPIDMELELRTEAWAPKGSASDEHLDRALDAFEVWARSVLDSTDQARA
jgi:hypothetical protein